MMTENLHYPLLPSMALVKRYPRARGIAWILVIVFAVLVVLMALMPWQQSISGAGRVTAQVPLERQQKHSKILWKRWVQRLKVVLCVKVLICKL